jgi:L-alanine-DL-glutamate epimerase-like enolase superfamily enzyme
MKIGKVLLYIKKIPMSMGNTCSLDQNIDTAEVVLTRVETTSGIVGYGECGTVAGYPATSTEIVAGSSYIIEKYLMDKDPCQIGVVEYATAKLFGLQGAIKTGFDMACWDILGKSTEKPLYELLGGKLQNKVPIYCLVTGKNPDEMAQNLEEWRAKGFKRYHFRVLRDDVHTHQKRIGRVLSMLEPDETCNIDFAGSWRAHDVVEMLNGMSLKNITIEQPCWSLDDCKSIRDRILCPVKLDDSINSTYDVLAAYSKNACDSIVLHINRLGGISPIRLSRDIATKAELKLTYSTQWGTELTTSAMTHLALTTSPDHLITAIDAHNYSPVSLSTNTPIAVDEDDMWLTEDSAGLGVDVDEQLLGKPVKIIE